MRGWLRHAKGHDNDSESVSESVRGERPPSTQTVTHTRRERERNTQTTHTVSEKVGDWGHCQGTVPRSKVTDPRGVRGRIRR